MLRPVLGQAPAALATQINVSVGGLHAWRAEEAACAVADPRSLGPAIRAWTACSRYRPSKDLLNPPKRPYAPPARAWGHHHGAVPGAAEPEGPRRHRGRTLPPGGRLDQASHPENRPEAYLVLYIMVIRAFLKNIPGDPEPVATTHSDTR
jgi:hypothetical protein